jgi:hypothetical protein
VQGPDDEGRIVSNPAGPEASEDVKPVRRGKLDPPLESSPTPQIGDID